MINKRTVTAIIVARKGSSRFPGKALAKLAGVPSLLYMIRRVKKSKLIDDIVVATTAQKEDESILSLAKTAKVKSYAGSEQDVLKRVNDAAKKNNCDVIVFLTGDCPFIDPDIIDEAIRLYDKSGADFVCNYLPKRSFPNGVDVEVFSAANLRKLNTELKDVWDREHVTGGFTEHQDKYRCIGLIPKKVCRRPDIRITLDEPDDLVQLNKITKTLKNKKNFCTEDVIKVIDKNPSLKNVKKAYEPVYTAAVIGLGMVGSLYDQKPSGEIWSHCGAYDKFGRIRLIAGCDSKKKNRDLFVERWKCPNVYASAQTMLKKHKPEIVSIAVPDELHYSMLKLAVKYKPKAIFCEKPISKNLREAKQMVALCQKNNIVLAVNHWHRWSDVYRNVRRFVVDEKQIGDIQHAVYWYTKGVFNSGSHVVDLLRWFFGDVAWAQSHHAYDIGRKDQNVDGYLFFKKGFGCTLATVDWRKFIIADFDIVGTNGRVVIDNSGDVKCYLKRKSKRFSGETEIVPAKFPYKTQLGTPMLEAVKDIYERLSTKKGFPACSGEDGKDSIKVIAALQKSKNKRKSLDF